jgi:Family of unknown function (DUF5990)
LPAGPRARLPAVANRAPGHDEDMQIRIEGRDFPHRAADIRVGVQRRNKPEELLEPFAGDTAQVVWTLEAEVKAGRPSIDLIGPYVQGGPGKRFIYLSWVTRETDDWTMFRRAKLMLADVPGDVLAPAAERGLLIGRLSLRDPSGGPICASIRPPAIDWSLR